MGTGSDKESHSGAAGLQTLVVDFVAGNKTSKQGEEVVSEKDFKIMEVSLTLENPRGQI